MLLPKRLAQDHFDTVVVEVEQVRGLASIEELPDPLDELGVQLGAVSAAVG